LAYWRTRSEKKCRKRSDLKTLTTHTHPHRQTRRTNHV